MERPFNESTITQIAFYDQYSSIGGRLQDSRRESARRMADLPHSSSAKRQPKRGRAVKSPVTAAHALSLSHSHLNQSLSMDRTKLKIIIEELKTQIRILEEQCRQKDTHLARVQQQQAQERETLKQLLIDNEDLKIQEEQRRESLEQELLKFCKEQEDSIKEVFQQEIFNFIQTQEALELKVRDLEREKEQIMKLNHRLLRSEQHSLENARLTEGSMSSNNKIEEAIRKKSLHSGGGGRALFTEDSVSREASTASRTRSTCTGIQRIQTTVYSQATERLGSRSVIPCRDQSRRPLSELGNYSEAVSPHNDVGVQRREQQQQNFSQSTATKRSPNSLTLQQLKRNFQTPLNQKQGEELPLTRTNTETFDYINSNNNNPNHLQRQENTKLRSTSQLQALQPVTVEENLQILRKVCSIYGLENARQLPQCVQKTEQVMKTVPKLEQLISQICKLVLRSTDIDLLLPTLKTWAEYIPDYRRCADKCEQVCKIFQIKKSENFVKRVELVKMQLDDYLQFLALAKQILHMEGEPGQKCLQTVINLLQSCSSVESFYSNHLSK